MFIFNRDVEMGSILGDSIRTISDRVIAESFSTLESLGDRIKRGTPAVLVMEAQKQTQEVVGWVKDQSAKVLILANQMSEEEWKRFQSMGATEYLLMPFERSALVNRVRGMLDRRERLKLCEKSFDVFVEGERIHLTNHEFKLLSALVKRAGEVLSRDELLTAVQGAGVVVLDRAIDTHIFSLRKKLGSLGKSIKTVRSCGYRFEEKN